MEPIFEHTDFDLIEDLSLFDNMETGRIIGLKNLDMTSFYPSMLYKFYGHHLHPNRKYVLPCLVLYSELEYPDEALIYSSRMYLDSARLQDFKQNDLHLWVKKKENSIRFIQD